MDELTRQILNMRREIERDPSKRIYHRLADALIKSGRPAAALDIAEKGLFIHDKKYLACQETKGSALLALGRYGQAVEALAPLARHFGGEARRKLAMALFGLGREEEAKGICRELLQANPFDQPTSRLLAKGRIALPSPIVDEAPLPDFEDTETVLAAELKPVAAPADGTRLRVVASAPAEHEEEIYDPDTALAAAPSNEVPAAPDESAVKAEPASPSSPPRTDPGILMVESVALHQAREEERPFDASVAEEAEVVMERFFSAIQHTRSAETAVGDEPVAFSPALETVNETPAGGLEAATEFDPTAGMAQALDIEEVDVFGDLGSGSTTERVNQSVEDKAVVVANAVEDSQAGAAETTSNPITPDTPSAPKTGRWKRLFRGWRE